MAPKTSERKAAAIKRNARQMRRSDALAAAGLTVIRESLDLAQAEIDKARSALDQIASTEDAGDAAAVAHVRGMLASGAEEIIPADVVKRLDAGEPPVRVFREFRNMTQGQLAEQVGVGQAFISQIEGGKKHPTTANLARLAKALNIDADLLLPDAD